MPPTSARLYGGGEVRAIALVKSLENFVMYNILNGLPLPYSPPTNQIPTLGHVRP